MWVGCWSTGKVLVPRPSPPQQLQCKTSEQGLHRSWTLCEALHNKAAAGEDRAQLHSPHSPEVMHLSQELFQLCKMVSCIYECMHTSNCEAILATFHPLFFSQVEVQSNFGIPTLSIK